MAILGCNTSISHTYGNVACLVMEYIKKYFGDNYFKTQHISTKLAYRQLDIFRTQKEFFKRSKPMLILRPRIELNDSSVFMYGTAMTQRMTNALNSPEFTNTMELFKDNQKGAMMRFGINRLKVYYDVVIIVETMNQQINLAHALSNMVIPNRPFKISAPLESYIPKNLLYPMCDYLGMDRMDTAEILKYMNTNSVYPITYKLKNSSGNKEFFCLYDNNIEVTIGDMSLDDGNDKGMIQDAFSISMSMSCEFYAISTYYLYLKGMAEGYSMCPMDDDTIDKQGHVEPLYSIPLLTNMKLDEGWKIYNSPTITIPHGVEEDVTDITELFDKTLMAIIKHQRGMNLPLDIFLKFKVYKGTQELTPNEGYIIDLDSRELIIKDCDHRYTYRLFIIINNLYIHSLSKEIVDFNK